MRAIISGVIIGTIRFFLWYSVLTYILFELYDRIPSKYNSTGIGMLVVIIMGAGFILGSFRMGASYSDKLDKQEPGPLFNFFKRPIRSLAFGVTSILLAFLLLYILMWIGDLIFIQ